MAVLKSVDKGLAEIIADDRAIAAHGVKFGVQADAGSEDGVSLLDIAIWNEFGTEDIPPRPFMRDFLDKNRSVLDAEMDRVVDQIRGGAQPRAALAMLGEFAQNQQRAHVRASPGWAEPNARSTIRAKGSAVPLIDDSVLVNAIRYEVL